MNPLNELKELLKDPTTGRTKGTVLKVEGTLVTIRTGTSTKVLKNNSTLTLNRGDTISMQGDTILGKYRPKELARIFYI